MLTTVPTTETEENKDPQDCQTQDEDDTSSVNECDRDIQARADAVNKIVASIKENMQKKHDAARLIQKAYTMFALHNAQVRVWKLRSRLKL